MGSAATGDLFTQQQYDAMRERLQLVPITNQEAIALEPLDPMQRTKWLKAKKNKKAELRKKHKVERQRRKAGRK